MTTPTISDLLKYADLQMAAEAFLNLNSSSDAPLTVADSIQKALVKGNSHASKFTETQAERFLQYWTVEKQLPNTDTGFSGTLFRCIKDDPTTGAVAYSRPDPVLFAARSVA